MCALRSSKRTCQSSAQIISLGIRPGIDLFSSITTTFDDEVLREVLIRSCGIAACDSRLDALVRSTLRHPDNADTRNQHNAPGIIAWQLCALSCANLANLRGFNFLNCTFTPEVTGQHAIATLLAAHPPMEIVAFSLMHAVTIGLFMCSPEPMPHVVASVVFSLVCPYTTLFYTRS